MSSVVRQSHFLQLVLPSAVFKKEVVGAGKQRIRQGLMPLPQVLQLGGTALLCRVLPKVKPPCTYSLLSIRAQIAALKMSMVLQASEMLADASIVPAFIRMCGATFGHGCAMGLQAHIS